MQEESSFSWNKIKYAVYNVVFISLCALLANVNGGGTGDIEEGEFLIIAYLVLKGAVAFIRGALGISIKFFAKKKITPQSIFSLSYSVIIISAVIIKNTVFGFTVFPYDITGFKAVNATITLIIADCALFLIYSVIFSGISLFRRRNKDSIPLALNGFLAAAFITLLSKGIIGEFVG